LISLGVSVVNSMMATDLELVSAASRQSAAAFDAIRPARGNTAAAFRRRGADRPRGGKLLNHHATSTDGDEAADAHSNMSYSSR
jgi:hypothetical protein